MKKILNYLTDNTWTWVGTGLVLITLSGATLRSAIILTLLGVALHSVLSLGSKEE